jgi:hypothetical protein
MSIYYLCANNYIYFLNIYFISAFFDGNSCKHFIILFLNVFKFYIFEGTLGNNPYFPFSFIIFFDEDSN